jgi:RNase P/RNase MRP subunit p30
MNTPREPNVRIRSAEALEQARSWARHYTAPSVHRPTLTLEARTIRHVDQPDSLTQLIANTGAPKPVR